MKAKFIFVTIIAYLVGLLGWCYVAPFILNAICEFITRNQ